MANEDENKSGNGDRYVQTHYIVRLSTESDFEVSHVRSTDINRWFHSPLRLPSISLLMDSG